MVFTGYNNIVRAATGGGTATIAVDGGAQGAGVTVVQSTSHTFTAVLTINVSGMTLGAASPTFTIPTGFTAPNASPVAVAGDVNADGKWSVVSGTGSCVVDSAPGSPNTTATGQVITVDITADCANGDTITLTYKGTSNVAMGATALTVSTADAGDPGPVTPLLAGSPTITVTAADVTAPTVAVTMDDDALNIGDTSLVTFTFSETPVEFATADVTVANGSIGAIDTSNPLVQTATYTPTNGITDATNVITVGTAWTDAALNAGVGDDSPNYTIDTTAATETITVIKLVVGGTKVVADFPLFVNASGVTSGVANSFPVPATYTVTETSNTNYTASFSGFCPGGVISLTLGTPKICTITNTYAIPPVSGSVSLSSAPVPPLIDVLKVPSPLALPSGPGPVTYTYTLRNIGTVPVTNITMAGDSCSPIIFVSGDANANAKLEVNERWVYRCTTTLSQTHTNVVTTTGWANGISAVDIATATVVVGASIVPPLIHVTKVPNTFLLSSPGGAVTYTYTVTNPGTVPLSNVSVTDDKCTGLPGRVLGHPGDLNKNNLLETNETWSFVCQTNLTQTTTNTVTASGDANGLTARDFAIATVVVSAPGFPKTGFPSEEKKGLWNYAMNLLENLWNLSFH